MKNRRSLLFRLGTILFLIAVCAVCAVIGRGHTVYFDNKVLEYNGETYPTLYSIGVTVAGKDLGSYRAKERGMADWMGQNFKMDLVVRTEKGGDKVPYSFSFKLPYNLDGVVINLPGLLAGLPQEAYMSEFVSLANTSSDTEEDEIVTEDFGLGDL